MNRDRLYLVHIQERIKLIDEYTVDGWDFFRTDQRTQDAVIRSFEIIGEAVKRLSPELCAKAPQVPWRRIAGFRDVLVHQYAGVDIGEVWRHIESEMPALRAAAARLLADLD